MNTPALYRLVTVTDIDLSENRYTLTPFPVTELDEQLKISIITLGILHPPLLLECADNRFIVLSGRNRIQVVRQREPDCSITALVLNHKYAHDHLLIFRTLLQHQLIGSSLTSIEQAIFCKKAMIFLTVEDVLSLLPIMGLKAKPHIPAQFISLLDLDLSVQQGIHKGALSQRAGKKLAQFSHADQRTLTELIQELQLRGSKQQKLIDLVLELSKRLQVNVETLLEKQLEREKGKQQNGPQKASLLLKWLEQKCRPRLGAEQENFKEFCTQLALPTGTRVSHTLSFEDQGVTLHIDFNSRKQLTDKWPQIQAVLEPKRHG